jgi:hypothetical protein
MLKDLTHLIGETVTALGARLLKKNSRLAKIGGESKLRKVKLMHSLKKEKSSEHRSDKRLQLQPRKR